MMMFRTPLKERARGRWKAILLMLGLADTKTLSGKHGPCPFCGGRDRFRFDDKDGLGTFICSHCGAGDGVTFVMRKKNLEFKDAAALIESVIGAAPKTESPARASDEQHRRKYRELFLASSPVQDGDPVSLFLRERMIDLASYPACLRYHPGLHHRDDLTGATTRHPGMLAVVHDAEGQPATLHRTYLTQDGRKADVHGQRKLMPGSLPKGSAVRLAPARNVLGIAEGIETALAASILFDIPVWAAINAGNMGSWRPPPGVEHVIVFGDNDPHHRGQATAYHLASKIGVGAKVIIPSLEKDWNDHLISNTALPRGRI